MKYEEKYFYYIDLGFRCYEVVWSFYPINTTTRDVVAVNTLRGTSWKTPACELGTQMKPHFQFSNSYWPTIESYQRDRKINMIIDDK